MKNKKTAAGLLLALILTLTAPGAAAARAGDLLIPVGQAVGIELACRGVVVTGFAEVQTDRGGVCPAKAAGLLPGDVILKVDGEGVADGEAFLDRAARFDGGSVTLRIRRNSRETDVAVTPEENREGVWQLGLWLRDSVHGIGTVTFYAPATGEYGALGHGVSLPEGEGLMDIAGGSIFAAAVVDVAAGRKGEPGELRGAADAEAPLGRVTLNTARGIFGTADAPLGDRAAVPVAADSEIRPGQAVILATVDDGGPREFAAEILRVELFAGQSRQLTIAVTDPALLGATGGIVQGMSGSPILQNGKLVGAVTHVLLSDPTKGYGITMENMLSGLGRGGLAA